MKSFRLKQSFPDREGVLVTGCSSGIGRATALYLAQQGFTVFATVRKESDAEELRAIGASNLIPICPLDLTQLDDIPDVVATVTETLAHRGKSGLYALVNNAGGGTVAPIELMDLAHFRTELETRVLGAVALVQAFLPLIRRVQGRIVWIVTPATIPTPYVTSIHACDFAVNCIARTLEIELASWKIRNIMIRCGGIDTRAARQTNARIEAWLETLSPDQVALYSSALHNWKDEMKRFDANRTSPERVAETVFNALIARKPKHRYMVGHMARFANLLELLPQTWVDAVLVRRFRR